MGQLVGVKAPYHSNGIISSTVQIVFSVLTGLRLCEAENMIVNGISGIISAGMPATTRVGS